MLVEAQEDLFRKYKEKDKLFNTYFDDTYQYLVNFSQTKNLPIHRWFYYQEGYSPKLVENIINHLGLNGKGNLFVLDPFAGSGTTLLKSKEMGFKAIGFEINSFSAFIIKVKTRDYSEKDLKEFLSFTIPKKKNFKNVYGLYELKIIKKLFKEDTLEKIETIKEAINTKKNTKVRDLLFATLLSILEPVSNYRKGGNGLKRKRVNKDLDPFESFNEKMKDISEDLCLQIKGEFEPEIINDSCLDLDKYNIENIDISIFSPPYANCFDPFEVYKIELWLGNFVNSYDDLRIKRKRALTSNLNANLKKVFDLEHRTNLLNDIIKSLKQKELWDKRLPKMIDTYFHDMFILLNEIYNKTKREGYCIIVVGNSSYGNIAIPTDIILGEIGQKAGFKVKEIIVARTNETSSQQHTKIGKFKEYIRESLVILQK